MNRFAAASAARLPRGHALVLWLLPLAFLHGLFSALRWPMLWATDHMVFNYHFGFGKRGLFGTILHMVAPPPYHYATLARLGFIIFGIWIVLLAGAAWRSLRTDAGMAVAFVLFFLSAGFSCLVDDMGYLEHVGLVLLLLGFFTPSRAAWLPVRAVLAILAVLVHEANFLMLVPVMALDAWHAGLRRGSTRAMLEGAAVLLPAAALTYYIGNVQTGCDHEAVHAYFQSLARDFFMRRDAVETFCRDGMRNLAYLVPIWSSGWQSKFLAMALVVVLPSTLFNLALAARVLRGKPLTLAVAVLATASPVALIVLGADLVRFVSLMQVTSLLVLLSGARRLGLPADGTLPHALRNKALLCGLAGYELATALMLTDTTLMMKFPFVPLVQRLLLVLRSGPFVVIPPF
jgi:hypothetical protein